jgi:hypothetical protein
MIDEYIYMSKVKADILYHVIDLSLCKNKSNHKKYNAGCVIKSTDKVVNKEDIIMCKILHNSENNTILYESTIDNIMFTNLNDIRKYHYKKLQKNIPIHIHNLKHKEFYYYNDNDNNDNNENTEQKQLKKKIYIQELLDNIIKEIKLMHTKS